MSATSAIELLEEIYTSLYNGFAVLSERRLATNEKDVCAWWCKNGC
jgi:hypothetical protein